MTGREKTAINVKDASGRIESFTVTDNEHLGCTETDDRHIHTDSYRGIPV